VWGASVILGHPYIRETQLFVKTVIRDGSMWPLAVITAAGVAGVITV
jgi:hypothetical protein